MAAGDRRRYADVAKPGGERLGDRIAAETLKDPAAPAERSARWRWALLFVAAAAIGAAYGMGWLNGVR